MQAFQRSSRAQELLDDESRAVFNQKAPSTDEQDLQGRFANLSPKASAGRLVFSAALQGSSEHFCEEAGKEAPQTLAGAQLEAAHATTNGVGQQQKQEHHLVTSRVADATRSTFQAARDANQNYGVTDKIGEGAKSAYTKARDFEQQHHVTSRVSDATRSTFQAARDANQKYGVTDKIGEGARSACTKARDFEQQHHVTSRVSDATRSTFQAARDANQKYGVTDKIGEGAKSAYTKARDFEQQHHVTSRVSDATRSTFQAARDANQKYGVTDKIGEGAKSAYTKARDFEQQHHVLDKVGSGMKAGLSGAASAASSVAKGANPFAKSSPQVEAQAFKLFLAKVAFDDLLAFGSLCKGQFAESVPRSPQPESLPVRSSSGRVLEGLSDLELQLVTGIAASTS